MAQVFPFRAFRYNPDRAPLDRVIPKPYDKIPPAMQEKYYAPDPHNLIAIEKGRSDPSDTPQNNVYTRAAASLEDWIRNGIVHQDPAPSFYAYSQEYTVPGTEERRTRRGFIGAGQLEDYSARVVFRHECRSRSGKIDPEAPFERVMMTFINTHSEGLTILPPHRVASHIHDFSWPAVRRHLEPWFAAEEFPFSNDAKKAEARKKFLSCLASASSRRTIGVYPADGSSKCAFYVLTLRDGANLHQLLPNVSPLQRELDVVLLHEGIPNPLSASLRKRSPPKLILLTSAKPLPL